MVNARLLRLRREDEPTSCHAPDLLVKFLVRAAMMNAVVFPGLFEEISGCLPADLRQRSIGERLNGDYGRPRAHLAKLCAPLVVVYAQGESDFRGIRHGFPLPPAYCPAGGAVALAV